MRYEYQYTREDVWNFIRIWCYRKEQMKELLLRLLYQYVFWIYIIEMLLYKQDKSVKYAAVPVVLLAVCAMSFYKVYRQVCKRILGVNIILCLEDGYLKVAGRSYREHDLAGTGEALVNKGLILIPVNHTPPSVFVLLPDRVFADKDEQERFLWELGRQREYADGRREADAAIQPTALEHDMENSDGAGQDVVKTQRWQVAVAAVILIGMVVAAAWMGKPDGEVSSMWEADGHRYAMASVPIEEQIRVLEGLGLSVSSELKASMEEGVRENPDYRSYIEDDPYIMLLSGMGIPQYDYDTWEILAYPKDVYWFDLEAFDLEMSYAQLIEAVEHLSGGEVRMDLDHFEMDAMDWEKGTGKLVMVFDCNGHTYTMELAVSDDWMDVSVLPQLNEVLEQEACSAHLCTCWDNGQGIILFYRDTAWEENFEKATGLALD